MDRNSGQITGKFKL